MEGFAPEFTDTADFSRKITHRIWSERGVDRIRDYYAEDVIFRTSLNGISRGNEAVIANTLGVMHEFPDRRIFDEDFIWAEKKPGVFYNSHRLLSKMTQTGSGMFGPSTGRRVTTYTIADIMYRRNQAFNEYLVRDHAGVARQLGQEPQEIAARMVAEDRAAGRTPPVGDGLVEIWADGSASPPPEGKAAIYAGAMEGIWGKAALRLIRKHYHDEGLSHGPGPQYLRGPFEMERFAIGYLAAVPGAWFRLHHWVQHDAPDYPTRVSLRWSCVGEHAGAGAFGAPTGARVAILGISQCEMWGDRVMREWHGIDDLSIWKQIERHRADAAA